MHDPQSAPMGEQELIELAGELEMCLRRMNKPDWTLTKKAMNALRAAASPRLAGSRDENHLPAFEAIPFDDDADELQTWKGLAISAIMDMRRYAGDETPSRRMVSARAYEEDAIRIESLLGPAPPTSHASHHSQTDENAGGKS